MKFLLFILVIIDNLNVALANNDNCGLNDLNALMVRLRQLRTDMKTQHDATQAEIKVLKEANGQQETELENLRQEIINKSTEIKLIKEENRKQERELEELRQDVNNTSSEIATLSKDIEMIKDIDDCSPNQCQNGATCTSYTCSCVAGYNGTLCEIEIDECNPNPCQNGATCADGVDSYTCMCVTGYTGTNCETDIDDCNPNPCQNGATCTDGGDSYTCTCVAGYTGTNCETVKKCPANWYLFKGICYYRSNESRKWLEAEKNCTDLGGHLVEITSEEENNFTVSILGGGFEFWIGLNDIVTEDNFVWVSSGNNVSGVYNKWADGEPNDEYKNEDCVQILYTGDWNDAPCSLDWPYICEKESISFVYFSLLS